MRTEGPTVTNVAHFCNNNAHVHAHTPAIRSRAHTHACTHPAHIQVLDVVQFAATGTVPATLAQELQMSMDSFATYDYSNGMPFQLDDDDSGVLRDPAAAPAAAVPEQSGATPQVDEEDEEGVECGRYKPHGHHHP